MNFDFISIYDFFSALPHLSVEEYRKHIPTTGISFEIKAHMNETFEILCSYR
jgi:hypothetical protein